LILTLHLLRCRPWGGGSGGVAVALVATAAFFGLLAVFAIRRRKQSCVMSTDGRADGRTA